MTNGSCKYWKRRELWNGRADTTEQSQLLTSGDYVEGGQVEIELLGKFAQLKRMTGESNNYSTFGCLHSNVSTKELAGCPLKVEANMDVG
jgi:hypothetical protein